jgi:hypothetical protein
VCFAGQANKKHTRACLTWRAFWCHGISIRPFAPFVLAAPLAQTHYLRRTHPRTRSLAPPGPVLFALSSGCLAVNCEGLNTWVSIAYRWLVDNLLSSRSVFGCVEQMVGLLIGYLPIVKDVFELVLSLARILNHRRPPIERSWVHLHRLRRVHPQHCRCRCLRNHPNPHLD